MGEPTSSEYIRVTTDWSTLFRHGGAACVRHCAAAPFAGSGGSADFVRRTSPGRREGGRSGHAAPPPQASATTSTRRRRARWNSGCSTTRWITAPLPRPLDQPGATTTASTTTTTAPETLTTRGTLQHEDTPTPHGESPDPPQQHPAPPTLAAQQAAALIWVAAQHDIARRDNVINTMRNRWWQQLCSRQSAQTQQRQLRALRCARKKPQQLAAQELRLEAIDMAKTMERLQKQIRDQALELTRLRNGPVPAAPQGSEPSIQDDLSYIS